LDPLLRRLLRLSGGSGEWGVVRCGGRLTRSNGGGKMSFFCEGKNGGFRFPSAARLLRLTVTEEARPACLGLASGVCSSQLAWERK
jgi:hypothetical protein